MTEYQVQLLGERSRNAFERVVRVKHVEFQSDKAEEDAFAVFAASVEFDDEGKPKEPDKALEALLKERPYLVKAEKAPLAPNLNAGPNNGKGKVDEEARKKELAQRFRIRV